MKDSVKQLTSARKLAKNSVLNILGTFVPLLFAIIVIPILIKVIGTDRFGILTLMWALVGYFGLFDLGLGFAVTKLVAERIGSGQESEIPEMVWTAQIMMLVLGGVGAFLLIFISPWLVNDLLVMPETLNTETLHSFIIIACSIPFITSTAVWRGMLMAYQRFDYVNIIRASFGTYTFLGPLIILPFFNTLVPIAIILLIGRIIVMVAYIIMCFKENSALCLRISAKLNLAKRMLSYGSWMTVSNLLRPLLMYMDRFCIGIVISTTAVAYYTTPYEIITKLTLLPVAISTVLFPAFSTILAHDSERIEQIFFQGVKYTMLLLFPLVIVCVVLAKEILTLWLNSDFADQSTLVLQILAIGILVNSIAHLPSVLIQGAGRPDITAKLNIIELPIYLVLLYFLLDRFGIYGAAFAWSIRVGMDTFLLYLFSIKLFPIIALPARKIFISLVLGLLVLSSTFFINALHLKIIFLVFFSSFFIFATWKFFLTNDERQEISGVYRRYVKL